MYKRSPTPFDFAKNNDDASGYPYGVSFNYKFRRPSKKKVRRQKESSRTSETHSERHAVEFDQLLNEPAITGTLEDLLDGVTAAGDRLKRSQTTEDIRAYRLAVKSFLRFIVDHVLDVEEHVSGINVLKRKKFTLVRVIDQKLENLANAVLLGQSDQLDILRRLEEINGLLVDLTT